MADIVDVGRGQMLLDRLTNEEDDSSTATALQKETYNVEEFVARRYCNTSFAMIYVYITSWTRSILIKAVAGDDCQDNHAPSNIRLPASFPVNIIQQPKCFTSHIATCLAAFISASSSR